MHRSRMMVSGLGRPVVALACAALLAACGARGLTIADIADDPTIVTGSVSTPAPATDPAELSDASTIRNVVAALDLEAGAPADLAWANASTGSRGALRAISEYIEAGTRCRRFEATRESFDGIALYQGESCLASGGIWAMTAFARL